MSFTPVVRVKTPSEAALDIIRGEFPEYHPLLALARLAHREDVRKDPVLELDVHRTILPYVAPKLATKEVEPLRGDDRRIVVSLFEDVPTERGLPAPATVPLLVESDEVVPLSFVT